MPDSSAPFVAPAVPSSDGSPPLARMERRGQIEVDAFCTGCFYNLHGQPVTVDERLQLPVCRCPECGRFHPAGVGVSASSVWVRRLGTVLLYNWVMVVVATALTLCFFLGAFAVGSVESYTRYAQATTDGQPVVSQPGPNGGYVIAGTHTPVQVTQSVELLHPIRGGPAVPPGFNTFDVESSRYGNDYAERQRNGPGPTPFVWLSIGSVATGLLAGSLAAVFLWHWPRRRYGWCLLVVVLPMVVVGAIFATNTDYMLIRRPVAQRLAFAAVLQGVAVGVGTRVGRPIARGVARAVIPPKPRQLLAFLWQVDGKPLPAP